jgi:hypothetical protein
MLLNRATIRYVAALLLELSIELELQRWSRMTGELRKC